MNQTNKLYSSLNLHEFENNIVVPSTFTIFSHLFQPKDCHKLVTWKDEGQHVEFVMLARRKSDDTDDYWPWVAIGFSPDGKMVYGAVQFLFTSFTSTKEVMFLQAFAGLVCLLAGLFKKL